jgi:hypothetical protein
MGSDAGGRSKYWEIQNEHDVLPRKGFDLVNFMNFDEVRFGDGHSERQFHREAFFGGQRLALSGNARIKEMPSGFRFNLFNHLGLLATPEVAATFEKFCPEEIQLFPVAYRTDPRAYVYIHVLNAFDCIDYKSSDAEYNARGRPYSIKKLVLIDSKIDFDVMLFTQTMLSGRQICRRRLKTELLKRHEIRGVKFVPVESV